MIPSDLLMTALEINSIRTPKSSVLFNIGHVFQHSTHFRSVGPMRIKAVHYQTFKFPLSKALHPSRVHLFCLAATMKPGRQMTQEGPLPIMFKFGCIARLVARKSNRHYWQRADRQFLDQLSLDLMQSGSSQQY